MKCVLLFTVMLTSVAGRSQIEIKKKEPKVIMGTIKVVGSIQAQLYYRIVEEDTLYTLLFRNQEYQQLVDYSSVTFSAEDNTLKKLYDILKSVFTEENKKNKEYKVKLKLGETEVIISNFRIMGGTSVMFFTSDGYITLTEKQVDKLFGI